MKVICAGFPKTGTKTLACAFDELGLVVFDYIDNFWHLDSEWNAVMTHDVVSPEHFRRMFQGVDAVCDFPSCFFWEELHAAFPDAKIVLSLREDEDEDDWWKSMRRQVLKLDNVLFRLILAVTPTGSRMLGFMRNIGRVVFGQRPMSRWRPVEYNEALMRKSYRRHNSHVLKAAPKDKLLVYKCSQGWKPLCEFLDLPLPNAAFPHKNVRGNIIEEALKSHPFMRKMKLELVAVTTLVVGTVVALASFQCCRWRSFGW